MSAVLPARAGASPAGASIDFDRTAVQAIFDHAAFRSQGVLLETEAMALLDVLGVATPRRVEFAGAEAASRLTVPIAGERVVLKVLAPHVPHKTEAGGVKIIANRRDVIVNEIVAMEHRFARTPVAGFVLYEHIAHDASFGHEFLLGVRWTREFGPVVMLGPGGIHAEFLAKTLRDDASVAMASPAVADRIGLARSIARLGPARLVNEPQRGRSPELSRDALVSMLERFLAFARMFVPDPVAEFEVNPLVVSGGRLIALDALLRLTPAPKPASFARPVTNGMRPEVAASAGRGRPAAPERPAPARPIDKIASLLAPHSIAVVGVSESVNPGRIILRNILRQGFPPEHVIVVKPGPESIEGCRCVPRLADLATRVDLAVLSVPALASAELIAEIADRRLAESVVLIAGGLEEQPGMEGPVARMHEALHRSRRTDWEGPVVNGGNCLGIRSVPGGYDTLFIPDYKLPAPSRVTSPVALLSASGAFAVSKASKLAGIDPRYIISLGNQMDLTVSDYLEHLESDDSIRVFAIYLEGFRPRDGERFLRAAHAITRSGRPVILYRGGRSRAGADAAASHTAAVAGDYRMTRQLAESAGALVAETLEDFEDLVRLCTKLEAREVRGLSLGAISNAGYECVALADALGPFRLAAWTPATNATLNAALERARLTGIVAVRNPIDLTPMLGDEGYAAVARAVLEDPEVDAGVIGCVPLTAALDTLAAGPGHSEDLLRRNGVVRQLIRLNAAIRKPWVAVVDAGDPYDPMVRALEDGGIPTFRSADRALRLLGRYCEHRVSSGGRK